MPAHSIADVDRAIKRLKSLHGGDLGVIEVTACGERAIPALRQLLFERERSGLYEVRCRAAEALGALGAFNVLMEFLKSGRRVSDPVERVGEDAVINAAALAISKCRDERVFDLLLALAKQPSLTGVIGALASYGRVKAIPALINALEDDASRHTAETGLRRFGRLARPHLVRACRSQTPLLEQESESNRRRRRSALGLLAQIGISRRTWPALRQLLNDPDPTISVLACKLCLSVAPKPERRAAIRRLIDLLAAANWNLADEIETTLVNHFVEARDIIEHTMADVDSAATPTNPHLRLSLLRIQRRGTSTPSA